MKEGGHGLIKSTLPVDKVPYELGGMVDRPPGSYPPGTKWSPFLACSPIGNWWALWRTIEDKQASRPGMVQSHVLLAELSKIGLLPSISELIKELPEDIQDNPQVEFVNVSPPEILPPTKLPTRYTPLVEALTTVGTDKYVVYPDQGDFPEIFETLWYFLWPEARTNLRCLFVFGPESLGQNIYNTIILTPAGLEARWHDHRIVGQKVIGELSFQSKFLSGEHIPAYDELIRQIDTLPPQISALSWIDRVISAQKILEKEPTSPDMNRQRQIWVSSLSPDPKMAKELKSKIVKMYAAAIPTLTGSELGALSNLDWSAYKNGSKVVGKALIEYGGLILSKSNTEEFLIVINRVTDHQFSEWWRLAIGQAVNKALKEEAEFAKQLWSHWDNSVKSIEPTFQIISDCREADKALSKGAPAKISKPVIEGLSDIIAIQDYPHLRLIIDLIAMDSLKALQAHLESGLATIESIDLFATRVPGMDVVAGALNSNHSDVICVASKVIVEDKKLFKSFDPLNNIWQKLWELCEKSFRPVTAIEIDVIAKKVVDGLIGGTEIKDTIVTEILNNAGKKVILKHPRQSELWEKLSITTRSQLLKDTADQWIADFESDPTVQVRPTGILGKEILERIRDLKKIHAMNAEGVVQFCMLFQDVVENELTAWLKRNGASTWPNDSAIKFGGIVMEREWPLVAKELAQQVRKGNQQALIALSHCKQLLGWWDKLLTPDILDTQDNKIISKGLFEVLSNLYPKGPMDRGLWERSGGSEANLSNNDTGLEQWRKALKLIESGGADQPTINSLLNCMVEDFPRNDQLQTIKNFFDQKS